MPGSVPLHALRGERALLLARTAGGSSRDRLGAWSSQRPALPGMEVPQLHPQGAASTQEGLPKG